MRILFVGETWNGSSARSMRDALGVQAGVEIDDIGEDHYFPKHRSRMLRGFNRVLAPLYRAELRREMELRYGAFSPQVLMVYKGSLEASAILHARRQGILTVNIFPDYSPLVYGPRLRSAMGVYDLVISTKAFHPDLWNTKYGYTNRCVFVPHGYDPAVHYCDTFPVDHDLDVVLVANARPQYVRLLLGLAGELPSHDLRVGIAGPGWAGHRALFPAHWEFSTSLHGRSYVQWLRRGRIAIAPVNSEVVIRGERQPGDADTTRTYELAAAGCFFLHYRTPFAQTVYDEESEVPMWDTVPELANQIKHYLALPEARKRMAQAAHKRAVPAYSIPARASAVLSHAQAAMSIANRVAAPKHE